MISQLRNLLNTNKSLSLLSSSLAAVLGLVTYGLLARSFSVSELGFWAFFMSVYTLFDMLRTGMMGNALIKGINECSSDREIAVVVGSGWKLSLYITLLGSALISLIFYLIYHYTGDESYKYLFQWTMPIALISIPHSMAIWVLNAYQKFGKLLWIRFLLQASFLIGIVYQYYFQPGLNFVLVAYLLSNLLPGILAVLTNWCKVSWIKEGNRAMRKSLFHFGKYTMGTSIASNLLRSSDTFILMWLLGPGSVAIYNVAEKLLGLFDIPLRSFVVTTFPQMVKKFSSGLKQDFINEFEAGAGFSTLLLLPLSVITLIFAEPMVVALAGEEYIESAAILRIFAVYTALTPLDRFCGMALDVVNKPDRNFFKVVIMLLANIVGDIIVLQYSSDPVYVACISIFTFAMGIIAGFVFLSDTIPFRPLSILQKGKNEFPRLIAKYMKR